MGREGVNFAKGTWRAMDFNRVRRKWKEKMKKMKKKGMRVLEVLDLEVLQSLGFLFSPRKINVFKLMQFKNLVKLPHVIILRGEPKVHDIRYCI